MTQTLQELKDEMNYDEYAENTKLRVKNILISEIIENENNQNFKMSEIEWLAQNIQEVGLLQNLVVQEMEDGKYKLIAGHRRLAALKLLGENDPYDYWVDTRAYVVSSNLNDTDIEHRLIASNAVRNYTDEEKKEIILQAKSVYKKLKEENKKPNGRERDWLVSITGFGYHTVKKFEGDYEEKELIAREEKEKNNVDGSSTKEFDLHKETTKIIKTLEKAYHFLADHYDELEDEEKEHIQNWITDLESVVI